MQPRHVLEGGLALSFQVSKETYQKETY
jgi:hypothetical protein